MYAQNGGLVIGSWCSGPHPSGKHYKATISVQPIYSTRDGQMSSASISHFGKSWNPNLVCLKPDQVKPMTIKLILVIS